MRGARLFKPQPDSLPEAKITHFNHLPQRVVYQATQNTSNSKQINLREKKQNKTKLQVKTRTVFFILSVFSFEIILSQHVTLQSSVKSGFITENRRNPPI